MPAKRRRIPADDGDSQDPQSIIENFQISRPPKKTARRNGSLTYQRSHKIKPLISNWPMRVKNIVELPLPLLVKIFASSDLDVLDRLRLELVCSRFREAAQQCWTKLTRLSIDVTESEDERFNSSTLVAVLGKAVNIQHLTLCLSSCLHEDITGNASLLQFIADHNRNLKSLTFLLAQMKVVFLNVGLATICHSCRYLTELNIENSMANDLTLHLIANYVKSLESLVLKNCWFVKDDALLQVIRNCKFLNYLDVSYTKGITNRSIQELITTFEDGIRARLTSGSFGTLQAIDSAVNGRTTPLKTGKARRNTLGELAPRKTRQNAGGYSLRPRPGSAVQMTVVNPAPSAFMTQQNSKAFGVLKLQLKFSGCKPGDLKFDSRFVHILPFCDPVRGKTDGIAQHNSMDVMNKSKTCASTSSDSDLKPSTAGGTALGYNNIIGSKVSLFPNVDEAYRSRPPRQAVNGIEHRQFPFVHVGN